MGKKATNIEVAERKKIIYSMIIQGISKYKILEYVRKNWGIGIKSLERYMGIIAREMQAINTKNMIAIKNEAIERYEDLYKRLFDLEKYYECIQVQARIDKINGIEVTNVNLESNMLKEIFNKMDDIK
jgi:hypothetical protein